MFWTAQSGSLLPNHCHSSRNATINMADDEVPPPATVAAGSSKKGELDDW